ncbi:superoxide dismutase family protein [Salinithrix halophila]|uniref:Superoxide dismutase family protein n=1 Tax=Salinithrix halophila TaxID=1485204 RepID=A0ABV8JA96_9BACL
MRQKVGMVAVAALLVLTACGQQQTVPKEGGGMGSEGEKTEKPGAGTEDPRKQVVVEMENAKGKEVGTATLQEETKGVEVRLNGKGLPPGKHGLHIHEQAECDAPDFKSAGKHFNPEGKEHGLENPKGAHAGDLPNLKVKKDGTAQLSAIAKGVTLGKGKHSLVGKKGTALVIHEQPDDMKTDPVGKAGDRIACGEIEDP